MQEQLRSVSFSQTSSGAKRAADASIEKPKITEAMLEELNVMASRLKMVSETLESLNTRIFGEQLSKEDRSAPPVGGGVLGSLSARMDMIRAIVEKLEVDSYRLSQLA